MTKIRRFGHIYWRNPSWKTSFSVQCTLRDLVNKSGNTCLCQGGLNQEGIQPSWHRDVVATLSQHRCWRYHNVVVRSKMRVVSTSVSNVVTTSLSDVAKTLPKRRRNIKHWISRPFYYRLFWFLCRHRNLRELQKC